MQLHPRHFGRDLREKLVSKLMKDVEGTCSGRHGFVVAITGIENVGKGLIRDGTGFVTFPVKYQCVVFRPFKGEILEAVVTMVNKMGFLLKLGQFKFLCPIIESLVCIHLYREREMDEGSTGALVSAVKGEVKLFSAFAPAESSGATATETAEVPADELDRDLLCPICMQIIKDAFLTACGHSFCYMCIITHLHNKKDCPCCGHYLTNNQLFPNFLLDKVHLEGNSTLWVIGWWF